MLLLQENVDDLNSGNKMQVSEKKSNILDLYWKLAEPDDGIREDAAISLIADLVEKSKLSKNILLELEYPLDRLIRGLASSNKAARLGFFVALVSLLKQFKSVIGVDNIFKKIEKELTTIDNDTQITIGRCLAVGSLVRSGLIMKDENVMHTCLEALFLLCNDKNLAQISSRFVVDLLSQTDSKLVKSLWQKFQGNFEAGWEISSEMFLIFLNFYKLLPFALMRPFLLRHFGMEDIFSELGLRNSSLILMGAGNFSNAHPLYDELLKLAISNSKLEPFWKCISNGTLSSLKKERVNFGFNLVQRSLPLLTEASHINVILCPQVVDHIIRNLANKTKLLYSAAADLVTFLVNFVKDSTDSDFQFGVLKCLIEKPGSLFFDEVTHTKIVYRLISYFNEEAGLKLFEHLKEMFYEETENEKLRFHIFKYIGYLQFQNEISSLAISVLQFLILHAYFDHSTVSQTIPQCERISNHSSDSNIHKAAEEGLNRCLITLLKKVNVRTTKILLKKYCEIVNECLNFIKLLFQNPKVATPFGIVIKKKELISFLNKVSEYDETSNKSDEQLDLALAFKLLILHIGFRMLFEPNKASVLEDIYTCHKKAFSKKKVLDDSWTRVLIDVLLSILSEDNSLLRHVGIIAFDLLVPQLTLKAVEQILDVIDPKNDMEVLGENSDEDDDDDNEMSVDGDKDDDDDETSEEDTNIDEEKLNFLRSSVKDALGDAAECSSDEESDNYLNDDEMCKLDDQLAKAFQMMKKRPISSDGEQEALIGFRNRCLDLVDIVVKRQPKINFLMSCIVALTNVVENGMRQKNQNSLTNRSLAIVNYICNIKKFKSETSIEKDLILNTLKKIDENIKVSSLKSNVCQFIVRCAGHCDKTYSQICSTYLEGCIDIYKEWLTDFLSNKNANSPQLFTAVIKNHFVVGWRLTEILLKSSFNFEIRLFQRKHGVNILKLLTSKQIFVNELVNKEGWESFFETSLNSSEEILGKISSDADRSYCLIVLQFLQNIMRINKRYGYNINYSLEIKNSLKSFKENSSGNITNEINKLLSTMAA